MNTTNDPYEWNEIWDLMSKDMPSEQKTTLKSQPKDNYRVNTNPGNVKEQDFYYDYLESADIFSEDVYTANPIYPSTEGKDSDSQSPEWDKEDFLDEIIKLKDELFELENKLARLFQGSDFSEDPVDPTKKSDRSLLAKIKSTRENIDKISDKLGLTKSELIFKVKDNKDAK